MERRSDHSASRRTAIPGQARYAHLPGSRLPPPAKRPKARPGSTDIQRLREALAEHPEVLQGAGLDVDQLVQMLDPLWLFRRATQPLYDIRDDTLSSTALMPEASRDMTRSLYATLDQIEYHLLNNPPPQPPLSTAGVAGAEDTSVGDLYLAGLYIVWKDLDPQWWSPDFLRFIPPILQNAIKQALTSAGQAARFDTEVLWTIEQAMDRATKTLTAVILVMPPVITPAMLGNDRYDENVDVTARTFLFGVPLTGPVRIRPATLPGRALTSQSLFSGQGWDDVRKDLETVGKNLAGEIVASTVDAVAGAVETYLLDAVEVALEEAIEALTDVVGDVTDAAGQAMAEFLTTAQTTSGGNLVYQLLSWLQDNVVDTVLPGRESLQRAAREFIMSRIQSLQSDMVRDVYERTDALRSQAVFGFVVKDVNNSTTIEFEEGSMESDIVRRVTDGWYVRIGNTTRREVGSVTVADQGIVRYTLTLTQPVTASEGDLVVAAPQNVTDDAYTAVIMLLWGVTERSQSVIDRRAMQQTKTSRIDAVGAQAGDPQADPQQQRNALVSEADGFISDLIAGGLGADDYDELRNSEVRRRIVRALPLGPGSYVSATGSTANWHIEGALFVATDLDLYIAVRGTPSSDGDYRIQQVIGSNDVITAAGPLTSFALDPALDMTAQVISRISVRNSDVLRADAVNALTGLVQDKLNDGILQSISDFVSEGSNGSQDLQGLESDVVAAGGRAISDSVGDATDATQTATNNIFRAAGVADNRDALDRVFDDLETRATALADDILTKVEGAAGQAVAKVWARAFIWTCIANFEFQKGEIDEGGGFLGDWSANILVLNTITDNEARRGGGLAIRGVLPNILLFNDIIDNEASESGGGVQAENLAWPVLVLNRIEGNRSKGGGGFDFREDTFPVVLFNEIRENFAVGNPSGCGGGGRIQSFGGLLLANEIRRNDATYAGGGLYVDGSPWALFNEISRNHGAKLGGGVYASGRGWLAFNEIRNNDSSKYGANVCANDGARARFTANDVRHGSAKFGGGWAILGQGTRPRLSDTIRRNSADLGGGVYIDPDAQARLAGAQIGANTATSGGGIYVDGTAGNSGTVRLIGLSVGANRAERGHGGGIFTARNLVLGQSGLVANLAGGEGGGLHVSGAAKVALNNNLFMANYATQGGGACLRSVGRLTAMANQYRQNRAVAGNGSGLYAHQVDDIRANREAWVRNYTQGYDGAGAYVEDSTSLLLDECMFQQNIARPGGAGFRSPPAGGGLMVRTSTTVGITRSEASGNAAELGGAVALDRCTDVSITRSRFVHNVADHDRDGYGRGGAIYATGAGSHVRIGGDFDTSTGNTFVGNTAGTADDDRTTGASGRHQGHGGAIAIVDGPVATVEGNTIKHNAATHDGGGIYFEDTAADSRIGGDNDSSAGGAWQRFGNAFAINCAVPRFDEPPPPCCEDLRIFDPGEEHYRIVTREPPPEEWIEQREQDVPPPPPPQEDDFYIPTDPGLTPPCEGWIFDEPPAFTAVVRPPRIRYSRREITFPGLGTVERKLRDEWQSLPVSVRLYLTATGLFSGTGGSTGNLRLYTLWPALAAQVGDYIQLTPASTTLMGWDPALEWKATNAHADGAAWRHGRITIREGIESERIGPIVTRRGACFAIVRGDGTQVVGNRFERNYARHFGGGGMVDQSDRNTVIGVPPPARRNGRNLFMHNSAGFGGGLALLGGTRARVVFNRIGGSEPEANFATGGGGICIVGSSPEIGAQRHTTEISGNLAGVDMHDDDRPPPLNEYRRLRDADILAAGGGMLIIGPPNGAGPVLRNLPITSNRVVAPARSATPGTGMKWILAGGGIAQLDRGRARLVECLLEDNEVVLQQEDAMPPMEMLGGGMAVLFDESVVSGARRDAFGTSIEDCRFVNNRLRVPHAGTSAPEHDLYGGGLGGLFADRVALSDSYLVDNAVMRELPVGDEPSPVVPAKLAGGGLAMRDCRDSNVLDTRLERNRLINVDQQERMEGGGMSFERGDAAVTRSWAVNNFSERNGGGAALRGPGRFVLDYVTLAGNDALGQGSALYASGDLPGSIVRYSILDGFGAWDQAVAYGTQNQNGLVLVDNCLWAPLGETTGGTLALPVSSILDEDPGFSDPDALPEADYTVRQGSPCLNHRGLALGYQPQPGAPGYQSRRIEVPLHQPTITDALAFARPGDIIDVAAGEYAETVELDNGVILRAPDGPDQTRIRMPPTVPPPDELITIRASGRRTAIAGFTVDGRISALAGPPPVSTGHVDTAIAIDPGFQGVATQLIVHNADSGMIIGPALAGRPPHPAWLGGNTFAKCDAVCIVLEGFKNRVDIPGFEPPCRIATPDQVRGYETAPIVPTIEHNLFALSPGATGIDLRGDVPVSTVLLAFNYTFDVGNAQNGYVSDAFVLNMNAVGPDPLFEDAAMENYRLQSNSPVLPDPTEDDRHQGGGSD